jgi:hypothetical protein
VFLGIVSYARPSRPSRRQHHLAEPCLLAKADVEEIIIPGREGVLTVLMVLLCRHSVERLKVQERPMHRVPSDFLQSSSGHQRC